MLAALVLMAVGIVSSWRSTVEGEDVSPEVSAWKAYSEIGANAAQALVALLSFWVDGKRCDRWPRRHLRPSPSGTQRHA